MIYTFMELALVKVFFILILVFFGIAIFTFSWVLLLPLCWVLECLYNILELFVFATLFSKQST